MSFQLKNKRVVITGGTSGIGLEIVRRLHIDNEVIVIGRSQERLREAKAKCPSIAVFTADLSKSAYTISVGEQLAATYPSIDILINNAASQYEPGFIDPAFDRNSIVPEITLNFTSICLLTHCLLPRLTAAPRACILNVNSALSMTPKTSSAVYCASKGALNIFTRSLRYQLEDTNVSVQQAFLPLVDTGMTAGRGTGKMCPSEAAQLLLKGITHSTQDHAIGKVKVLRLLHWLMPPLARRILKGS